MLCWTDSTGPASPKVTLTMTTAAVNASATRSPRLDGRQPTPIHGTARAPAVAVVAATSTPQTSHVFHRVGVPVSPASMATTSARTTASAAKTAHAEAAWPHFESRSSDFGGLRRSVINPPNTRAGMRDAATWKKMRGSVTAVKSTVARGRRRHPGAVSALAAAWCPRIRGTPRASLRGSAHLDRAVVALLSRSDGAGPYRRGRRVGRARGIRLAGHFTSRRIGSRATPPSRRPGRTPPPSECRTPIRGASRSCCRTRRSGEPDPVSWPELTTARPSRCTSR